MTQLLNLKLGDLRLSETPAQIERRRRFDKAALGELADSIRSLGLQQPIVVRQVNGHYQVVAGERRVLAARQAKLETIDAIARDLTDEQVLEVQLIENLQREGLHELVEAEGYEALIKQHHRSVDDIVAKVGKSKGYVYARLKLLALAPAARKAFNDGDLNASIALLVARIPVPELQDRATKEITEKDWNGRSMSYKEAVAHVHEKYTLRLDQAPFDTADAELVVKAGACGSCPKRTGNQPELFGDIKSADVCTDPVCFAGKKKAHLAQVVDRAKGQGKTVIGGAEAKKIAPGGINGWQGLKGYTRLGDKCHDDKKHRTYSQIVGKDIEVQHLLDPTSGRLVAIANSAALAAALAKAGIKRPAERQRDPAAEARQRAQAELEERTHTAVLKAMYLKPPKKLGRADLELLFDAQMDSTSGFNDELEDAIGFTATHGGFAKQVKKLSDGQLNALLLLAVLSDHWRYNSLREIAPIAKRHGVDVEKIRAQVKADAKKPAPGEPAKKK